jgi:hypothetical protein
MAPAVEPGIPVTPVVPMVPEAPEEISPVHEQSGEIRRGQVRISEVGGVRVAVAVTGVAGIGVVACIGLVRLTRIPVRAALCDLAAIVFLF